ncbi:MAG: hypothetical protein QME62_10905, partial [Armatimonadota bacterium]|nr:hypothetical protein [Armatimonadota bacterium]
PRKPIRRNPWSEIECGEHYARAMSSWGLLLMAQGISYCGPEGSIKFNPKIKPENHRSFFSTAEGWGTFSQRRTSRSQVDTISLAYGSLMLRSMTIYVSRDGKPKSLVVKLSGKSLGIESLHEGTALKVVFPESVILKAGEKLVVEVKW